MKLTVQDIYHFPELNQMTLIAGKGGLQNEVRHCGILDYEYDKDVSSKYYDHNFYMEGGFLTLTSFLYAKNDPHLIYDAVKKLVAKRGSGLIIKNIFHLPISENVIRYADRMNYPIFLVDDQPFFEDIIVLIHEKRKQYQSLYLRESKTEQLLKQYQEKTGSLSGQDELIRKIHPSIREDLMAVCFRHRSGQLAPEEYLKLQERMERSGCLGIEDTMYYYKDGFLLIHSSQRHPSDDPSILIRPCLEAFGGLEEYRVGVSRIYHRRQGLAPAILESIAASRFHREGSFMTYEELGVYRAIVPFAEDIVMREYRRDYISPLEEYDSERGGDVLRTVVTFVQSGGDLDRTAALMDQHKNTIRYRLKRAGEVLNLNLFSLGDYEKIALAVRIYICQRQEY